jgi:hypothetical protein
MAQTAERLTYKHTAMSSNPSTTRKQDKNQRSLTCQGLVAHAYNPSYLGGDIR